MTIAPVNPPEAIDASPVEYFTMPGAPGRYFRCVRYGVMSTTACSQNFRAAPVEAERGRLLGCLGCSIGALHAGVVLKAPSARRPPTLKVCTRCRRDASSYGKQSTGWVRLVRQRTLCVSCFNREREAVRGANGKGSKPIKTGRPWPVCVAVLAGGKVFAVYLRAVQNLSFEAEGLIDRLWSGPPIDEISFAAPAAWWESLARRAERPQHAALRMLIDERPGAAWPPNSRAEPFQAPQWVQARSAAPDAFAGLGGRSSAAARTSASCRLVSVSSVSAGRR